MVQLVIPYKKHASTTSRLVAQKFNKRHADVLRAIKGLTCSKNFTERNFALSEYTDTTGRKLPEYIITKDGFVFLVMGFNDEQSSKFKEEYLAEFNRMEEQLRKEEVAKNPIPVYTMRILSNPVREKPRGYWTIFEKSHSILLLIESQIGCYNKFDLADGSIGKMWANYRKGQFWAMQPGDCLHEFDDVRGTVSCKCYHGSELQYFDDWLEYTYKTEHLIKYLVNKYKAEGNQMMLEKVAILSKLLNNRRA